MWTGILIAAVVIAFLSVLLVRTFMFRPHVRAPLRASETLTVDEDRVVESLRRMIRFKTVSNPDPQKVSKEAFEGFLDYLKERYPLVHERAEVERVPPFGILYRIKGKSAQAPSVLMSHYDVVPENGTWTHPPFSAHLEDGVITGRGTLDTKATLCAALEAAEQCLREAHLFENDLYLAFAGDEEVYGKSAKNMVEHFKKDGIRPKLVLDEGGAVVSDVFPGVKRPTAVVGLAEKGMMSIELCAKDTGGHASMPAKDTAVTRLSGAISELNGKRLFPLRLTPSVAKMFDTVARESTSFVIRLIFANLWVFLPLVKWMAKRSGGQMLSMFKTTQAFTTLEGAEAMNVLPSRAKAGVNYRLITGETSASVSERIAPVLARHGLEQKTVYAAEPTTVSLTDASFETITNTIRETWPEAITTPYLMMAATDSRHYHDISDNVYRFSPLRMSKEDLQSIHGENESIAVDNFLDCVRFYVRLCRKL